MSSASYGGGRSYADPDADSDASSGEPRPVPVADSGYRDDTDDEALNPTTPLLLSDVPGLSASATSTLTHAMLLKAGTPSSLADLLHSSLGYSSAKRPSSGSSPNGHSGLGGLSGKRHSHSAFSLSTWCASLCFFCLVAVTVLLVTACLYGLLGPFHLTQLSSASLTLLRNHSSNLANSFFQPDAHFARLNTRADVESSSAQWPFAALSNATSGHTAWVGLLAMLYSQPPETVAHQEAVSIDGYAVASFHDLAAVMDRQAGRASAASVPLALAIHIVATPSSGVKKAELNARLRNAGYSDWTYHSEWTRARLVAERAGAAKWLFATFANASAAPDAGVGEAHVAMMEHVSVLQAVARSSADAPAFAVVLEDDAVLTPGFAARMAWIVSALPVDFDAVFFGGCLNLHPALSQWQSTTASNTACQPVRADRVLADCSVPASHVTPLLIPTVRSRCSSGYLVSRASAGRLLSALQVATRKQTAFVPLDHTLNEAFAHMSPANSSVYQLEPPASYESSRLLQLSPPAPSSSAQQQPRLFDSIDYGAAVALPAAASSRATPHSGGVHGAVAPSAGGAYCDAMCGWARPFSAASISRAQSAAGTDWSSYISPTSFRDMADWVYWRHDAVIPAHDRIRAVNESVAIPCLAPSSVIYVQTTMLLKFFNDVHPKLRSPYFLITGSADQETPASGVHWLDDVSGDGATPKLLHWFGQNGNSAHPRFTQLPIGINYHEMGDALDQTLRGHGSLLEGEPYAADDGSLDVPDGGKRGDERRFKPRIDAFRWSNVGDYDRRKWLLANFALDSNPAKRGPALVYACGNETVGIRAKPWAECMVKSRGVSQYVSSMPAIYHHNARFRFHMSPEGNGLDCHRTWEAVYLGVVPVVKSGPLDPLLADMPAWIVEEWEEVNERSMERKWAELDERWRGRAVERLHFSYWKGKVIAAARHEMEQWKLPMEQSWLDDDIPRRRCWGPINQRADRKAALLAAASTAN